MVTVLPEKVLRKQRMRRKEKIQ